jgi:hypothetical protein
MTAVAAPMANCGSKKRLLMSPIAVDSAPMATRFLQGPVALSNVPVEKQLFGSTPAPQKQSVSAVVAQWLL